MPNKLKRKEWEAWLAKYEDWYKQYTQPSTRAGDAPPPPPPPPPPGDDSGIGG